MTPLGWLGRKQHKQINNSYSVINAGSARTVCERSVGPFAPPAPSIWWLSVGPCSDCEQQRTVSSCWYLHGSEPIRGRICISRGKLLRVYRLARVLAWYERAPGFKSWSGIVLCHLFHDQFRRRSHRNKHHHSGFDASKQEESYRSWCQNHPGVVPRLVTYFV